MADALFDTTVFIDFYRGDLAAQSVVKPVLDGDVSASYSPISTFEIWLGVATQQEEIDFSAILAWLEPAPLSDAAARLAAHWLRDISPRRAEALFRDALIAATAVERGETIVTRNTQDFRRFNVSVKTY